MPTSPRKLLANVKVLEVNDGSEWGICRDSNHRVLIDRHEVADIESGLEVWFIYEVDEAANAFAAVHHEPMVFDARGDAILRGMPSEVTTLAGSSTFHW